MPYNIPLHSIGVKKKNQQSDGILWSTEASKRNGDRESTVTLFHDDFNDQPDFTAEMYSTDAAQYGDQGYTVPNAWTGFYQSKQFTPSNGYPTKHDSFEILTSNSDKAMGGTGKSMVNWRESYETAGGYKFNSDSQLIRLLDKEYDELYVEFYISFSDNWWSRTPGNDANWQSKMLRIGSWSGQGDLESGINGDIGPLMIWDYKKDQYGVINFHTLRGGPWGENYEFNGQFPSEYSWGYTWRTEGMAVGGGNPQVVDQVNGGFLVDAADPISHDQLFGAAGHWTKVAIYVKKNSAIGVADGLASIFINDQRVRHHSNVPWVQANTGNLFPGFNYFAIGGNDYFAPFDNSQQFEDWYSIDSVTCLSGLPEGLK